MSIHLGLLPTRASPYELTHRVRVYGVQVDVSGLNSPFLKI